MPPPATWDPKHASVHHERAVEADGVVRTVMLRHPTAPFVRETPGDDDADLRAVGGAYFALVEPLLLLPAEPPLAIAADSVPGFGWLPGADLDADERRRRVGRSFWVTRQDAHALPPRPAERSFVLIAGVRTRPDEPKWTALGGRIGLRIVMHVAPKAGGGFVVRVTGCSCSRLHEAPRDATPKSLLAAGLLFGASFGTWARRGVQQLFGVDPGDVSLGGVGPAPEGLRVSGTVREGANQGLEAVRVLSWEARLTRPASDPARNPWPFELVDSFEQASAATAPVPVFVRDGASARPSPATPLVDRAPTRSAKQLDTLRRALVLPPGVAAPPSAPPVRSDRLSKLHLELRHAEFQARLAGLGFDAEELFRHAQPALELVMNRPLPGDPQAEGVNAMVRLKGPAVDIASAGGQRPDPRPAIQIRFGTATPMHREARTDAQGRRGPAEALGLAADPRWAWHEFGHVLAFASTGEFEFPFAHSMGDALAAVAMAADSGFEPGSPLAGLTFPWALNARRHDRGIGRGWCWCGRRNALRLAPRRRLPRPFGSYVEEQMLSSSVFRAWLALGGATPGDDAVARRMRRSATDHVMHLLVRATALLGAWELVPARSADQFLSALIDADVATTTLDVQAGWHYPADPAQPVAPHRTQRPGGAAHKVLRWAFEQQGLFATDDPTAADERVGRPPNVDLCIAGRGEREGGGYAPVPWRFAQEGWRAHPDALRLEGGGGGLAVRVHNRGDADAGMGTLRAWCRPANAAAGAAWSTLGPVPLHAVPAGQAREVALTLPFAMPAEGLQVIAEATCAEDRANTDAEAMLACAEGFPGAFDDEALIAIVAGDNNLGFAHVPPA